MIYIELDHLADIMKLANEEGCEVVYSHHLAGDLANWRLRISCFSGSMCFTFRTTGARVLVELGVIENYDIMEAVRPYEKVPALPQDSEARWRAISQYWRPKALEALRLLDLVTLGSEGTVMTPEEWGREL